jgi:hypothetical protein
VSNGHAAGAASSPRASIILKKEDEPRNRTKNHEKMGISIATPFFIPVKPMLMGIPVFS